MASGMDTEYIRIFVAVCCNRRAYIRNISCCLPYDIDIATGTMDYRIY